MATLERRLLAAVNTNKFDAVRCILHENPTMDLTKGHYLNWASSLGRSEMVDILIEAGAAVNEYGLAEKETPLQSAVTHGHLSIAQKLLEAGANANKGSLIGPSFPILKASSRSMATLLVQYNADVNVTDGKGTSALLKAVLYKRTDVVKVLLEAGTNMLFADKDGYTPLILAVEKGYDEIVRALLEHGADAETLTPSGRTLIELASNTSTKQLIESFMPNSKLSSAHTGAAESTKSGTTARKNAVNFFGSILRASVGAPVAKPSTLAPADARAATGKECDDPSSSNGTFSPSQTKAAAPQPRAECDRPGAERVGPPSPQQRRPNGAAGGTVPVAAAVRPAGMVVQAHCVVQQSARAEDAEGLQQATAVLAEPMHDDLGTVPQTGDGCAPVPVVAGQQEISHSRALQLEQRVARLESLLAEQSRLIEHQRLDISALKAELRAQRS